ncbi:competence/damage-inducible protein A [Candidatus Sumerlaeota bacterium]|nr:competence/damage-inducible protein A [Candidatus Sumerlaeota bacterium]
MRVALLSTGSEILQGLYPDTNAQWLAARLDALGFDVVAIRSASDDLEPTLAALGSLSAEADLILTTGGLGPTEDDRLREACAAHWRRPLVHSAELERQIAALFRRRKRPMPSSNRRQALIPRGAEPLPNRWGTAPGFAIPRRRKLPALIALPGPPVEMRPMFERRALPWLRRHLWPGVVRGRTVIHTIGWPEARVNETLADLFDADPQLSVTLLARSGKIDVRLTATAENREAVRSTLTHWRRVVRRRLPRELVWGRDDETLEEIVNRLLVKAGWTIAVAESCTGGLIAQRLTAVPGASRMLRRSVVTYADEAKRRVLGVSDATLRRHGAVSQECVIEMAEGVRRWAGAEIGLAVSGIAGPTGGTPEKPVGLVWIAASTEHETVAERHVIIRRERDAVRLWASDRALDLARRMIKDHSAKSGA